MCMCVWERERESARIMRIFRIFSFWAPQCSVLSESLLRFFARCPENLSLFRDITFARLCTLSRRSSLSDDDRMTSSIETAFDAKRPTIVFGIFIYSVQRAIMLRLRGSTATAPCRKAYTSQWRKGLENVRCTCTSQAFILRSTSCSQCPDGRHSMIRNESNDQWNARLRSSSRWRKTCAEQPAMIRGAFLYIASLPDHRTFRNLSLYFLLEPSRNPLLIQRFFASLRSFLGGLRSSVRAVFQRESLRTLEVACLCYAEY